MFSEVHVVAPLSACSAALASRRLLGECCRQGQARFDWPHYEAALSNTLLRAQDMCGELKTREGKVAGSLLKGCECDSQIGRARS